MNPVRKVRRTNWENIAFERNFTLYFSFMRQCIRILCQINLVRLPNPDMEKLVQKQKIHEAIGAWQRSLSMIPNPQNAYPQSLWPETSIGDAYFLLGEYETALEHLQNAVGNIEEMAEGNPFVMLRLGQACLENHRIEEAKKYLLSAHMIEGEEIFSEDDGKYLDFLKRNVPLE
jgi:tetratricopeptide (TPR) repeat protein